MTELAGLQQNINLADFVSLRTPAKARFFVKAETVEQICDAWAFAKQHQIPCLVLGGGSNMVISNDFDGLVLQIALKGSSFMAINDTECLVTAAAGEIWHELVAQSVAQGYRGIENLALIPGTVGAAPVQNIGAYGVELKDSLESVEVLDLESLTVKTLSCADCQFAYRHSVFKTDAGKNFLILSIRLRLSKTKPLAIHYGEIAATLQERLLPHTEDGVMQAVIEIRQKKLPDPATLPNVGSFFKNPIVSAQKFATLHEIFSDMVYYPLPDGRFKLAAGWLIDQCGWRGHCEGKVGVHDRQALVLVNPGQGSGQEILALAARIRDSVAAKYDVELEIEPVIV